MIGFVLGTQWFLMEMDRNYRGIDRNILRERERERERGNAPSNELVYSSMMKM